MRRPQTDGTVHIPVSDLNEVLGLSIPQGEVDGSDAVEANIDTIRSYTHAHFGMSDGEQDWDIDLHQPRLFREGEDSYVVLDFDVKGQPSTRPPQLKISFDAIIESKPDRDALLIFLTPRGWGRLLTWSEQRFHFDATTRRHVVAVEQTSWSQDLTAALAEAPRRLVRRTRHVASRLTRPTRDSNT